MPDYPYVTGNKTLNKINPAIQEVRSNSFDTMTATRGSLLDKYTRQPSPPPRNRSSFERNLSSNPPRIQGSNTKNIVEIQAQTRRIEKSLSKNYSRFKKRDASVGKTLNAIQIEKENVQTLFRNHVGPRRPDFIENPNNSLEQKIEFVKNDANYMPTVIYLADKKIYGHTKSSLEKQNEHTKMISQEIIGQIQSVKDPNEIVGMHNLHNEKQAKIEQRIDKGLENSGFKRTFRQKTKTVQVIVAGKPNANYNKDEFPIPKECFKSVQRFSDKSRYHHGQAKMATFQKFNSELNEVQKRVSRSLNKYQG